MITVLEFVPTSSKYKMSELEMTMYFGNRWFHTDRQSLVFSDFRQRLRQPMCFSVCVQRKWMFLKRKSSRNVVYEIIYSKKKVPWKWLTKTTKPFFDFDKRKRIKMYLALYKLFPLHYWSNLLSISCYYIYS